MNEYVLITAVKNEERYIRETCESIIKQTKQPIEWIIIDDESTDKTENIVRGYAKNVPFIKILKNISLKQRSFASQVSAQMYGYNKITANEYNFIGFLDGDIKLEKDYYENIISLAAKDEKLGIVGGLVIDVFDEANKYLRRGSESHHVAGGVQLFRKQCFKDINGYLPLKFGGQDTVAEIMAEMIGWKVRSFPELEVKHLKAPSNGKRPIRKCLFDARCAYDVGYDPLYYIFSTVRRLKEYPSFAGPVIRTVFYILQMIQSRPRSVNDEIVIYNRKQQRIRLRHFIER